MIIEAIAAVQEGIREQGSFGDYVRDILRSRDLVKFWVLLGSGFVGMLANYLFKWLRDEIAGSLWFYLASSHPKRTMLAVATLVGYAGATMVSPALDGAGWSVVINLGLTTGFAIDALINKAERKVWSDEQRKPPAS